jgi:hypothetical protein
MSCNFQCSTSIESSSKSPYLNLNIPDSVINRGKEILCDPSLGHRQARYLTYLVFVSGHQGCTARTQESMAAAMKQSVFMVRRTESALLKQDRLTIFEYQGRTYRSPYPTVVDRFLESQRSNQAPKPPSQHNPHPEPPKPSAQNCSPTSKPVLEPLEQNCSVSTDRTARSGRGDEPQKAAPRATSAELSTPPSTSTSTGLKDLLNPVLGKVINKQSNQKVTQKPVDTPATSESQKSEKPKNNKKDWFDKKKTNQNQTTKKNPYHKNRILVYHFANDLADELNLGYMKKWFLKLVWSVSEEAEEWLVHAVKWVKEELHCCRCRKPLGLLKWKLAQEGLLPDCLARPKP